MRIEEIEKLLVSFYEGNTTESQEEILKEYFRTHDVPKYLEIDKRLLLSFHKEMPNIVSTTLEHKLIKMIDLKEQEEIRFFRKNKTRRNWRWVGGIAASIVILFGVGYSIFNQENDACQQPKETFDDPQVAYEVLQVTLMEVSTGLNIGLDEVVETQKEIRKTNKEIKKDIHQQ